jgi:hypothetical protein
MAARTRATLVVAMTQQSDQLAAQLAAWHGVDGLMREWDGSQRRSHAFECTRYLLGAEACAEIVDHHLPQGRTGYQPTRQPGKRGLCNSRCCALSV